MVKLARGRLLIAALTLSLLASLCFVVFGLLRNWSWKQEAFVLAVHLGALRADHDFKNGTIRLLELDGEQDRNEFTGRLDGPFEIWNSQYFPSRGYPHQYSTEQMVIMYNSRMRYMAEHPDDFRTAYERSARGDRQTVAEPRDEREPE